LRNPFNSLIGLSDILLEELKNKNYEEAETYATYLNKSSNEGYAMLNNLLDWSMSQSGRIQFKPELFDFENFFNEIEQYCLTQNEKYGVQLKLENSIYRQISADANVLRIILINLLTNAFKYTPSGAQVQLKAKLEQNVLVLCVEDSGIGMTPEKVAQLLDKTQNVKSEHGLRNEKGIGLGIQIIHELIQIHKGNMQIRSEKGKGTSFELHFPIGVHV
jgi:signal transduction histidine kinase